MAWPGTFLPNTRAPGQRIENVYAISWSFAQGQQSGTDWVVAESRAAAIRFWKAYKEDEVGTAISEDSGMDISDNDVPAPICAATFRELLALRADTGPFVLCSRGTQTGSAE